jgi:UDP-N-acetylmuramoyl-tripeptide--D-alanyl-D-alanine ligase
VRIPFDAAVEALRARVLRPHRAPASLRVVTDTRSLEPGDTFLALRGERFDGHDFTGEAARRGASATIVERADAAAGDATALVVDDTLAAYMQLAALARARFRGDVLGITGSAGKTTTKVFAAQLLRLRFGRRVLVAPANENNEIGVSKLLLAADNDEHDALVVEMGARHYGDVAVLVEIARPDVGVLTNIGDAHLEIMGSRDRLEETKWALFGRGARAVLNLDDAASVRRARGLEHSPRWFRAVDSGADAGSVRRLTALVGPDLLIDASGEGTRRAAVDVRVPGAHNRANAAAAAAAALELGVPFESVASALADLRLPADRYEKTTLPSGATAIFDAYNANAAGTLAALDAFAREPASRHIAVLASMAELGGEAGALHERVGARAAEHAVDVLLVGGEFADRLARGARDAGLKPERIVFFGSNQDASSWLAENGREGDVILLKGSRKYKLEEVLEGMRS